MPMVILEAFADGALASFPLPVIDISNLSAQYLPPGIVWKFVIDSFFRELGYIPRNRPWNELMRCFPIVFSDPQAEIL